MQGIRWIGFGEGVRAGCALAVCVVVLAILGLSPSMSWVPEVPLLLAAILLPMAGYGLAGYRAGRRAGRALAGAIAGSVAGAISGVIAGVAYVIFGKSVLNVGVGLLIGAFAGGIVGSAAAHVSLRNSRMQRAASSR